MNVKPSSSQSRLHQSAVDVIKKSNPFRELDLYHHQQIDIKYFGPKYGIHNNQDYCDIVDVYNLLNPHGWLEEKKYWTDYGFANDLIWVKLMLRRHGSESPAFNRTRNFRKYLKSHSFAYNISTVIPFLPNYFFLGGVNHICKN